MRNRSFIIIVAVLTIIIIVLSVIIYKKNETSLELLKYESEVLEYRREIDRLNAKKNIEAILSDSLKAWREMDNNAIQREFEDLQENLDYYYDIQGASPKKVDKMYDKAIKELVAKYKRGELQP